MTASRGVHAGSGRVNGATIAGELAARVSERQPRREDQGSALLIRSPGAPPVDRPCDSPGGADRPHAAEAPRQPTAAARARAPSRLLSRCGNGSGAWAEKKGERENVRDPEDRYEDRHDVPERAHTEARDVVPDTADERVHEIDKADDVRQPYECDRKPEPAAQCHQRDDR